jgi:hypothetical protein
VRQSQRDPAPTYEGRPLVRPDQEDGYQASVANLARVGVSSGYTVTLAVGVDTTTTPSGGSGGGRGGPPPR